MRAPRRRLAVTVLIACGLAETALAGRPSPGVDALVVLLTGLPLLLPRPAWPAVAGLAAAFVLAGAWGRDFEVAATTALVLAVAFVAADQLSARAATRAAVVLVGAAAVHLGLLGDPDDLAWVVGAFLAPPFVAGRLVRDRRKRLVVLHRLRAELEAERDRVATLAATTERARIARDLEAVLASTLRSVRDELDRAPDPPTVETFAALHRHGSGALGELRSLLGVLHGTSADPAAGSRAADRRPSAGPAPIGR